MVSRSSTNRVSGSRWYDEIRPMMCPNDERRTELSIRESVDRFIRPRSVAYAHCDLPCGIYDPAQARIEAESVRAIQERYGKADTMHAPGESADDYRARCLGIKEQRADLVKHHL